MKKEDTHYRLLPMAGAYNMRDLGGYRTIYGKHVKWKTFLRSDDMNKLTSTDLDYLTLLPLRTVVDFRGEAEKRAAADHLPQTVSKHIPLPIEAGNMSDIAHFDKNNLSVRIHRSPYAGYIQRVFPHPDRESQYPAPLPLFCRKRPDRHCSCIAAFGSGSGTRYNNRRLYAVSSAYPGQI